MDLIQYTKEFSIFTKIGNSIQKRTMQKMATKAVNVAAKNIMQEKMKADTRKDMLNKGYTPASKEYNQAVRNAGKDGRNTGTALAQIGNSLGAGKMIGNGVNKLINK